jgi:hypothetical protein
MHYKNGRVAYNGDPVVFKGYADGAQKVMAGTLHSTNSQVSSCNGQVAVPGVGGCVNHYVTIGEIHHASDAFDAIELNTQKADAVAATTVAVTGADR